MEEIEFEPTKKFKDNKGKIIMLTKNNEPINSGGILTRSQAKSLEKESKQQDKSPTNEEGKETKATPFVINNEQVINNAQVINNSLQAAINESMYKISISYSNLAHIDNVDYTNFLWNNFKKTFCSLLLNNGGINPFCLDEDDCRTFAFEEKVKCLIPGILIVNGHFHAVRTCLLAKLLIREFSTCFEFRKLKNSHLLSEEENEENIRKLKSFIIECTNNASVEYYVKTIVGSYPKGQIIKVSSFDKNYLLPKHNVSIDFSGDRYKFIHKQAEYSIGELKQVALVMTNKISVAIAGMAYSFYSTKEDAMIIRYKYQENNRRSNISHSFMVYEDLLIIIYSFFRADIKFINFLEKDISITQSLLLEDETQPFCLNIKGAEITQRDLKVIMFMKMQLACVIVSVLNFYEWYFDELSLFCCMNKDKNGCCTKADACRAFETLGLIKDNLPKMICFH